MDSSRWLLFVALAGLSWGTYVPLIFYGGNELGGKPASRFMAILCVGIAYFIIGVLFPLFLFLSRKYEWKDVNMTSTGLTFAGLAGAAGAIGAICVIFATKEATIAARDAGVPPHTYRLFIAPLIFGLAPVINTLVSMAWHPKPGDPFHFDLHVPGWKLWLGIVLVGVGAALVLYAKEESEAPGAAPKPAVTAPESPGGSPEAPR
jgi:drug/metabolite transporter (DMT)-like permease